MQPATKPCKYCKTIKEGMESYKCDKCYALSHLACMKCKKPSRLKGDFLFLYECKDCNFQKKDVLSRMKISWVQIIHLALYNLTVNERGRQGFFRWKEEICDFIEKNWNILMPGKSKPPTWIGTIAGTLSVHSHNIFKSGQMYFNETGWWALQEVTIPKANPENYRINRQAKSTPTELLKSKPDNSMSPELGRGKRQRKCRDRVEEAPSTKSVKIEPSSSQQSLIVSPAECVKSMKGTNGTATDGAVVKPQNTKQQNNKINNKQKEIKPVKLPNGQCPPKVVTKNETVDVKPMSSSCAIMAELKDAGYSTAVQVEDPFASLFDDMSVFDIHNESLIDHFQRQEEQEQQTATKTSIENTHFIPIEQIKTEHVEKDELPVSNLPKALCKPLKNLNAIKPIERVSNVKPLSVAEETEFLAKLDTYPLTVESDCSVRRLRRKLLTRKRKRELGLSLFSICRKQDSMTSKQTETDTKTTESKVSNVEHEKNEVKVTKPSFNHPALVGVNVLDKFCNLRNRQQKQKFGNQRRLISLIGVAEDLESYQNSIVSPYTSRVLKPYIRRDFTNVPPKLSILREIQKRCTVPVHRQWPIDYCYVQPSHIPAVNALCGDFFWPGIDLTECLQYPEFSCVVMYRKLLIGFAFMVPDVKFNEAYISFILVHPDWRRSGIATTMIYHLIQTCMGKDITLHVSPSNPSMLLYQKFGFKAEALILDFYKKYMPDEDSGSKHAYLLRLQRIKVKITSITSIIKFINSTYMGAQVAKIKRFSRTPAASLKSLDKALEEKIISPRHPSTAKAFDELVKQHPEFEKSAKQKNEQLHDMLNSVRVDSSGGPPTDMLKSGKRARKLEHKREGKLSNEQLVDLFVNKKIAPELWSVEHIAEQYQVDADVARNLQQYFGSFYIYKQEKEALTIGGGKSFLEPDHDGPKM